MASAFKAVTDYMYSWYQYFFCSKASEFARTSIAELLQVLLTPFYILFALCTRKCKREAPLISKEKLENRDMETLNKILYYYAQPK